MIQLEMSDDGLLAIAKVLATLTAPAVGDRLTTSHEYREYFEAREAIDEAAETIIHAERATRRPAVCAIHGEPACVVCIAEAAHRLLPAGIRILPWQEQVLAGFMRGFPSRLSLVADVRSSADRAALLMLAGVPTGAGAGLGVHSHGTEDGAGLSCQERRVDGRLVGACVVSACPECRTGKHTNCDGHAWDYAADREAPCPCEHPSEVTL